MSIDIDGQVDVENAGRMDAVVGYAVSALRTAARGAAARRGESFDPVRSLFVVEDEVAEILNGAEGGLPLAALGPPPPGALPAPLEQLTEFERSAITLLAGIELIPRVDRVVGFLHDDLTRRTVSAGLLLDLFCSSVADRAAARAAFGPGALVRRLDFVAHQSAAEPLADGLQIDPGFLSYLCGWGALDDRLLGTARRISVSPGGNGSAAIDLPVLGSPLVLWGADATTLASETTAIASVTGVALLRIDGGLDRADLGVAARQALCDGDLLTVGAGTPEEAAVAADALANLPVLVVIEAVGGIVAIEGRTHRRVGAPARRAVRPEVPAMPLPFGHRIRPRRGLDRLVLPPMKLRSLQSVIDRVERESLVLGEWGLETGSSAGGVRGLFAGPPGTGKTLAAEAIASHLGRDLYVVDIGSVMSKYIGETEKMLAQVFSEAAKANVCLFFDEADALFGKRGEQKDAHDRYANVEVAYLLGAIDAYPDLVILATNLPDNVDEALMRRLDVVVEFSMPDPASRLRIWRSALAGAPYDETHVAAVAERFAISGGSIQNAALAAAFAAAAAQRSIDRLDLLRACRDELAKIGRVAGRLELGDDYAELTQDGTR